jgi:hypothetical protein
MARDRAEAFGNSLAAYAADTRPPPWILCAMRVVVELPGALLPVRIGDRDGRGISFRQGQSKIRIDNSDILELVDGIVSVAQQNREGNQCSPKAS